MTIKLLCKATNLEEEKIMYVPIFLKSSVGKPHATNADKNH
jgi:hypothetical protein